MEQPNQKPLIPVRLSAVFHNNCEQLAVYFDNHGSLNQPLQKAGARWSKTHRCWIIPLSKANYEKVMGVFQGKATVNRTELDVYLRAMNTSNTQTQNETKEHPQKNSPETNRPNLQTSIRPIVLKHPQTAINSRLPLKKKAAMAVYPVNAHVLPGMKQMLVLKGYSQSTQRTYLNEMSAYLQTLGSHAADDMNVQRIKDYLEYCHTKLSLSENTIHSRMNALKFYYEQVLRKEKFFWEIPRPKKHEQLPKIISVEKIVAGLLTVENLKHKTLLLMAYNAGLRVSEAVRIKLTDINRDRMQLTVEKSKGKKDRMVPLSKTILPILDLYIKEYQPVFWLFEGQIKGDCYSSRSAQIVFRDTYKKLGMPPGLSFHSLRHSYATHLHDNGTDIKFIQELLGHNDIKTTLRYTHVSKKELGKIENPLDAIMRRREEDGISAI